MSLRETLSAAVKESMKAGDKARLSVVRMIQAGLKDRDIEARGNGKDPIPDAEILAMLQKMIKQTQESQDLADKAGRADLVDQAKAEIVVLSSFLPRQMDEAETRAAIAAVVAETGAAGIKDMGKVIGVLKERFAGQMDFGKAGPLVKQALAG
ncbi:GatB/YqeY domain-containing protein [Labrys wisconsinensis]|uniref:Uncharacterized protein YqeY n=1 Tax=Labrys wisconsinensis TaxID=425677 RepID=A0ABU0JF65_9HYPH|nr:GatB/YqeY domain-containing protein [Labrys wisconsinensis]MDQ0472923.1 uncharacterized protein YqeY [Labrys wisconsinensis]